MKPLLLIGLLCLGGWGMMRVFTRLQTHVPTRSHAATAVLGHPCLADPETNIFHRRRCHLVCPGGERSRFTRKQHIEGLVGFESRADAIEAGYYACEECKP